MSNKKNHVYILLILWITVIVSFSYGQDSLSKELEWAQKFYNDGNYEAAEVLLKEYLDKNINNEETMKNELCQAYYLLSKTYFHLEKNENMNEMLEKLFKLNTEFEFNENEDEVFMQIALNIKNKKDEMLITIVLKDEQVIKGEFLSENDESVTVRTEFGIETIKKSYILGTIPSLEKFQTHKQEKEIPVKKDIDKSTISTEVIPPKAPKFKRFSIYFQLFYPGVLNVADLNYDSTWTSTYVDGDNTGNIFSDVSTNLGIAGGLTYNFNQRLGFSFSYDYLKQNVQLIADYSFSWDFWTGASSDTNRSWQNNNGSIIIMPISFDLTYAVLLHRRYSLNLNAGLTIFLSNINLASNIGFSDYLVSGTRVYVDWFDIDVKIETKDVIIGGNVGADFEYLVLPNVGFFIGLKYLYAPKKEYVWEIVSQSKYNGVFNNFDYNTMPPVQEIASTINFSFFKGFGGIKIYF